MQTNPITPSESYAIFRAQWDALEPDQKAWSIPEKAAVCRYMTAVDGVLAGRLDEAELAIKGHRKHCEAAMVKIRTAIASGDHRSALSTLAATLTKSVI